MTDNKLADAQLAAECIREAISTFRLQYMLDQSDGDGLFLTDALAEYLGDDDIGRAREELDRLADSIYGDLAEHDSTSAAPDAPAPVQVDVLGELADEIEDTYPNADASNLRAFAADAQPPAPAPVQPPANGEAELPPLPRRWYVGALNDGKFIVDTPPSPCGTDIPPDWGTPPELVLNVVALSLEQAREICDAHNAAIAALQQKVGPLALPEVTDEDEAEAWDVLLITGGMRKVLESYRARLMTKGVPND